jgi:hypothetical protein
MSDNPFAEFAGSLSPEQKGLLVQALGGSYAIEAPTEKTTKTAKKPVKKTVKKVASKKATVTVEETPVPRRKGAVKKVVRNNFRVENEDGSSAARRQAVRFRGNTWEDNGKLARNKNTVTPEYEPMPRERDPVQYINKRCHVCGRDEKVRADLVHGEFHRCSKCI